MSNMTWPKCPFCNQDIKIEGHFTCEQEVCQQKARNNVEKLFIKTEVNTGARRGTYPNELEIGAYITGPFCRHCGRNMNAHIGEDIKYSPWTHMRCQGQDTYFSEPFSNKRDSS